MAPPDASRRTTTPNLRLRALREARSESRSEFARALRTLAESMGENLACDERRVARWERGEVNWPRSAYRRVLSALLGLPIEQLGFQPPDRVAEAIAGSPDVTTSSMRQHRGTLAPGSAAAGADEGGIPFARPGDRGAAARRAQPEPLFGPVLDLSPETLESLESAVLDLCREYGQAPVREVIGLAQKRLALVGRLLQDAMRPPERRRLLVVCGWLSAVLGCALFDAGQRRRAETQRAAVRELGTQAGHFELAAWADEMSTWFALSEGRFSDALAAAQAGAVLAGNSSAAARLALHEAKSAARLRERRLAEAALERARAIIDRLSWPFDELNHFAMDEATLAAHAATAYLWLGDDTAAEDCAWQVLVHQLRPDGATRHPMRIAEIRCTLATVAARRHDLDQAVYFGLLALDADRVSVPTMLMRATELEVVLTNGFPGAKQTMEYVDRLRAVRENWRRSV